MVREEEEKNARAGKNLRDIDRVATAAAAATTTSQWIARIKVEKKHWKQQ